MYKIRGADGKDYGPVSADQVRQWIAERRANAQTLIQAEGATEWKPLSDFPEFATTAPPPTTAPSFPSAIPQTGYAATPGPRTNPLAITSMVLGILSVPCCGALGALFAVAALIFAGVAISQINKDPELQSGKGLAITGIILGSFGLIMGIAVTLFAVTGGMQELLQEFLDKTKNK